MDVNTLIAIASDHAGYELKEYVKEVLGKKGYKFKDFGCSSSESVDYPDYAHPLAREISTSELKIGIVICGSGEGVSIVANKHRNVRCALCWKKELASLARQHNDANVVALPARFISKEEALDIIDTFFTTDFEGGRHQKRVDKINE